LALSITISASIGIQHQDPMAPTMKNVHNCEDGSLGIGDFQGMKND
jgi:hypothetical protein